LWWDAKFWAPFWGRLGLYISITAPHIHRTIHRSLRSQNGAPSKRNILHTRHRKGLGPFKTLFLCCCSTSCAAVLEKFCGRLWAALQLSWFWLLENTAQGETGHSSCLFELRGRLTGQLSGFCCLSTFECALKSQKRKT